MVKLEIRPFGSLRNAAAGCLLLAACSGAEQGTEGPASESADGSPEAPAPARPGAAPTVPSAGNGPVDRDPSNTETPGASEGGAPPIALDPASGDDSNTTREPAGAPDAPGPTAPAPTEPDALIRGSDPTLESATDAGPFDVDTLTAGLRDGPDYGTQTLHVPVGADAPFASVVIVPGFVSPESSIRAWGPFLASHGIVTLTIGTNGGGDPPETRALALLDGVQTLRAENDRSGSPLQGQMALDRFGVMGWSMGGGGTLIAANASPDLRAAVSFAAWNPGAQFPEDRVPTLLLAGSADPLAGGQSQGFFESIPEPTPKMLFEVAGGAHDIANDPSSANGEVGRYGLSWLKVFLEGDERYRQFLLVEPSQASDFRDNL